MSIMIITGSKNVKIITITKQTLLFLASYPIWESPLADYAEAMVQITTCKYIPILRPHGDEFFKFDNSRFNN